MGFNALQIHGVWCQIHFLTPPVDTGRTSLATSGKDIVFYSVAPPTLMIHIGTVHPCRAAGTVQSRGTVPAWSGASR